MKKAYRHAFVYGLVALQLPLTSVWSAPVPPGMETMHLGIVRSGVEGDPKVDRAYPLLEKRVQRWLENLEALPARVEPLGVSVPSGLVRERAGAGRLDDLTSRLVSRLTGEGAGAGEDASALVERMREVRHSLAGPMRFGPLVQRSLVAEAAFLWRGRKRDEAMRLVKHASLLHPQGKVGMMTQWDERSPGFELAVQAVSRRMEGPGARSCLLNLDVTPADASVEVNGFAAGQSRSFSLPVDVPYLIAVSSAGHLRLERLFQCEIAGRKRWAVKLVSRSGEERGPAPSADPLLGIRRQTGMSSLLLIEAVQDEFRLYLYSSDAELAEIPLRQRIRVADVLSEPGASGLPIASDAFLSLMQKHDGRSLRVASADRPVIPAVLGPSRESSEMSSEASSSRWYNKWYFWAIAGGVTGGAAIFYFASRNEKQVQSHGGIFVTLK